MTAIRILVADDHAVLRSGLRRLLEDEADMEVVGEAATGGEAVRLADELRPDVVLMDLTMPEVDGVEATRAVLGCSPASRVLVLTMHEEWVFVDRVLEAGATGYLLKRAAGTELIAAIRAVHRGEAYVDPAVVRPMISGYLNSRGAGPRRSPLSPREQEVLRLVAWGYTAKEIAERLGVSVKTVESHKARMMEKLDLHTRAELVRHAMAEGLLDTSPC